MIERREFCTSARRVLFAACVSIVLSAVALAQGGGGGGGGGMSGGGGGGGMSGGGGGGDMSGGGGGGMSSSTDVQMPHVNNIDKELKQLTKALNLDADQQTKTKDLLTARNQQVDTLIKDFKTAQKKIIETYKSDKKNGTQATNAANRQLSEQARKVLNNIRTHEETQLVALLNDTQKTSYNAWKDKHAKSVAQEQAKEFQSSSQGGDMGGGGGGGDMGGGGGGGGMSGGGGGGGGGGR
jgi:hypothetical protein